MLTFERLSIRAEEAKLDPNDLDLNPHMNIVHVADRVVADLKAEGFDEADREGVYLTWLNAKIYGPALNTTTPDKAEDMSDLPWDDEDDRLAHGG